MKENNFKKIQELLSKNYWKLITISDLLKLLNSLFESQQNMNQFYKTIYYLKNKWFLISLKKELFLIKNPKKDLTEFDIENTYYRKILKKHCSLYCNTARYIWWLTALEINYTDKIPEIPEEIIIFNKKKQSKEVVMFEKKVIFKKYEVNGKNLIPTLLKNIKKKKTVWWIIAYANLELSILETLYNLDTNNKTYIENLIIKTLKKYKKNYQTKNLEEILKTGKFNSPANRFLKLITPLFPDLADDVRKIIKKCGYLL